MRPETRAVIAAEIKDIEAELATLRGMTAAQRQCVPGGHAAHVAALTRTLLALRADADEHDEATRSLQAYALDRDGLLLLVVLCLSTLVALTLRDVRHRSHPRPTVSVTTATCEQHGDRTVCTRDEALVGCESVMPWTRASDAGDFSTRAGGRYAEERAAAQSKASR